MRFKIEHNTNNEKEYDAIMDVIRHYDIEEQERLEDLENETHNIKKE